MLGGLAGMTCRRPRAGAPSDAAEIKWQDGSRKPSGWTCRSSASQSAALRHRLATVFEYCGYVNAGGLMSFGANLRENFQRAADYVDRLLEGAKPSSLPVDQAARSSW